MDLIGRRLESVYPDDVVHALRNALARAGRGARPGLAFGQPVYGRSFDLAVHRSGREIIVEFEPVEEGADQPLEIVRALTARISAIQSEDRLVKDTASLVRAILGYDRVMVYRFEADGAGRVIAEAKRGDLESFMGQYFPASDIPQQARILYLKNTIRIISDSSGAKVMIEPSAADGTREIDLSLAHLRSVSPIHLEYLRNMGVAASMSISIVIDNTLWGLIACHNYMPKHLTMAQRVAAETFGEFFSLHLDVIRQKRRITTAATARRALDQFVQKAPEYEDIAGLLQDSLDEFAAMVECDGIGLMMDSRWFSSGTTPPLAEAIELTRFIRNQGEARIWSTHRLSDVYPPAASYAAEVSGLLAVPLSHRPRDYMLFFRKEWEHTLNWGGDPNKSYVPGPLGDRLTPRKSFAIWKETVKGQSRPWSDTQHETGEAIRAALVETVMRHNEIVAEERAKADVRQRMLNEELNHRVKNILAIIKSLVSQPYSAGRSLEEYVGILRGRIDALAVAHDQIARGDGGGFLNDLLKAELEPYRAQSLSIVHSGPRIWLDTRAFSVMALVFHELTTNSAKYGALSSRHGLLDISWQATAKGDCVLDWKESGGPSVAPPSRKGFGTILITRSIPYDLGGESTIDFDPSGLKASFVLPEKHITIVKAEIRDEGEADKIATRHTEDFDTLRELPVLLVEDQMLIAMDVEMMLSEAGLTNIAIAASTADAIRRLKSNRPVVAILDVNLGSETSLEVAAELRATQCALPVCHGLWRQFRHCRCLCRCACHPQALFGQCAEFRRFSSSSRSSATFCRMRKRLSGLPRRVATA